MAAAKKDLCEDRAWLDAFRVGEPIALERVFRTYAPLVVNILRKGVIARGGATILPGLLGAAEQEDLLQEVFLRALRPDIRARYDGLRPFPAFLSGIVRNVVLDHARKRGRMVSSDEGESIDDAQTAWGVEERRPDENALSAEEKSAVNDFLAELSAEERRFIVRRFEDGVSQRDLADELGWSRQNVRTLDDKLRERFRAFLKTRGL